MNNLMKQAQKMQKQMEQMQKELEEQEFVASVGGGAVTVTANGKKDILAINIKPEVVDEDDVEMLEDLIAAAFNDAMRRAEEATQSEMAGLAGGIPLPPGFKFPF